MLAQDKPIAIKLDPEMAARDARVVDAVREQFVASKLETSVTQPQHREHRLMYRKDKQQTRAGSARCRRLYGLSVFLGDRTRRHLAIISVDSRNTSWAV